MSEGKERAGARLANLEAIEPLLGSLRVLSLSTMQMALNRQQSLTTYANRFSLLAAQCTRWREKSTNSQRWKRILGIS